MINMRCLKTKEIEFTEDELFDEKINKAIKENNPFVLQEQLGFILEKAAEICEEVRLYGKISLRNLKTIMFARDRKVLDIEIEKVTTVDLTSEGLDKELENFNNSMLNNNDSAVKVEGRNSEGKKVILYYYPGSIIKDRYDINRQMRVYNENGDVEAAQEQVIFSDGMISVGASALAAYRYDEEGNKKFAIYDDDIYGGRYFEYDEEGNIRYLIVENDYRYLKRDMVERLHKAFNATRDDFVNLDNSVLEKNLKLFSGEMYKRVANDISVYDER